MTQTITGEVKWTLPCARCGLIVTEENWFPGNWQKHYDTFTCIRLLRAEVASLCAALNGNSHHILLATQKQRAGLLAEKAALQQQVDGLVAERDAHKAENQRLTVALKLISDRSHTMQGTPMGSQRQERNIWTWMGHIADEALGR